MESLLIASILIAVLHTLANPSHYLPFVALGKAYKWGAIKSALAAAFCGLGHIVGFGVFAFLGIVVAEGIKTSSDFSDKFENLGKWIFLIFGIAYCAYGLWYGLRVKSLGVNGKNCKCDSCEACSIKRVKALSKNPMRVKSLWILFLIFCMSPCDVIVPLVFYPAVEQNPILGLALIGGAFYAFTILTMSLLTALIYLGISKVKFESQFLEIWAQFITGVVITLSGIALFFTH